MTRVRPQRLRRAYRNSREAAGRIAFNGNPLPGRRPSCSADQVVGRAARGGSETVPGSNRSIRHAGVAI
jgi:hypothetical protein